MKLTCIFPHSQVIALVISLCALRRRKRMSKYEEVEMI